MVIWHLKQIGKVKKLRKWMPHELTHIHTQIIVLKCCLLLFFSTTMNHFSIGLWCVMKSGLYTTTGDDQLSGWTKKKLQSTFQGKTCTKKDHGHCLVVCCPSDQLQPSESRRNHYIWKVYSANQRDALKTAMPAASTGQQNGSNSSPQHHLTTCGTNNTSKIERIGVQSFVSSTIFTWPFTKRLPLLQASQQFFCRESASTMSRKQKMPFQEFLESQGADFYTTGINKLISHLQKCVDCNGSYFDS